MQYITTPIYYVNDKPHIGHAYTTIAADCYSRYTKDIYFRTGTDEHGQKVQKSAEKAGVSPQDFCDNVSQYFRELTGQINASNNDFIRTTEARHKAVASDLWVKLQPYIYIDKYAGWYSVRDEAYYQEAELVDGKAPTGAEVSWIEEESYFFKLSEFTQPLLDFYEANPDFIRPTSRFNEVKSFVKGGLKDLSISRTTFSWGVPVPNDPKHIMYVWLDALANYLVGDAWDNSSKIIHFVGKDILRFHAVYWIAFLMAAKIKLPTNIVAHGWWMIEGEKMSKSLGNVVAPKEMIDAYGLDAVRYFLMREVPFGNDGNFAKDAILTRYNSELANNIGNLAQRCLTMLFGNELTPNLYDLGISLDDAAYHGYMQEYQFSKAIEELIQIANAANERFNTLAPWTVKKENPQLAIDMLYAFSQVIKKIFEMLQPFCPDAYQRYLVAASLKEKPTAVFPRIV
jgi:methionyl-tRNA synthetase